MASTSADRRPDYPVERLTGWGNTAPTTARVVHAHSPTEIAAGVAAPSDRGAVARGLGRCYGDAAQNAGGVVVDTTGAGEFSLDPATGVVTASAGASIDELLRGLVPWGFFVPVTPGTRYVTVGGAIASDIHGKNHHKAGSWCDHVLSFRLALPDGSIRSVTPESDPALFWATAGGMGLTGAVIDATFRCPTIGSSRLVVDTDRSDDLDGVLALMTEGDDAYDYSVAWIDMMATGRHLGRSVLQRGWFAAPDDLPVGDRANPFAYRADVLVSAPALVPSGVLNPLTIRLIDEVWYRKAPKVRRGEIQTIPQFFHPLDMIGTWNNGYGPRGFLQWQCALPLDAVDELRRIVELLSTSRTTSFVNVLKRFGPGNPGPLSFPMEGWTLSVDVAVGNPDVARLLDEVDDLVLAVGGRLYLAKDSRMKGSMLRAMYPKLDEWRAVKASVDPDNRLCSDLGRRLGLC